MESDHVDQPTLAMHDTVSKLFPGSLVRVGIDPQADQDFRYFPSAKRPNLVFPARSPEAAARTVWRFSAATGFRDSATRFAAGAALRVGAVRLTKDAITVSERGTSIIDHLSTVLEQPVEISIAIGTARANRKPVLEVFDSSGSTLAFAKIGVDEKSRHDVSAEGRSLRSLAGRTPHGIQIPAILDESVWCQNTVLVMSALPTRWQRPWARRRVPLDLMHAFSRSFGSHRTPLGGTPFWDRLLSQAAELDQGPSADRLRDALSRLEARHGIVPVTTGAWHGDWTPWNMAWRRGQLQLWDFERFDQDGLLGLDVMHYAANEAMQRTRVSQDQLATALEAARELLDWSPEITRTVASSYLAAIALRYTSSVSLRHGELVADRADFMIEALERQLASGR